MRWARRLLTTIAIGAVLIVGAPTAALAAEPAGALGKMVAMCAGELGERTSPPAVTCTCPDATMTFANFAAMVAEMKGSTCTACC